MKKALPWLIVAFLAVVIVAGTLYFKHAANLAEQKAQAALAQAAALEDQIKAQNALIAKSAADLAKVEADAAANEKAFLAVLAQVKTATPTQLVDQGSAILGVHDITTDGKSVTMGLETYRAAVSALVDWQEYKVVREPEWNRERGLLNEQIAGYKTQAALDTQRDAALAASIADLKKFISDQKIETIGSKILWTAAGAGVGLLVGRLLK